MFFVLALFFYIKGRLSDGTKNQLFHFLGVGIAFICASASKENSIVFPATVLLVEIVFFSPKNLSSSSKKMVIAGGFAVVVAVFIGLIVFSKMNLSAFSTAMPAGLTH